MFYTRWRSGCSSLLSVTWRLSPLMAHEVYLCIRLESSASRKHRGRKKEKMGCSDALHLGRDILSKNNCWENNRKKKRNYICRFSSVQFSHSVMSDFLRPYGLQHTRPPCPSPTPGVYPNSCTLSCWCHPTISSSVTPFSSCLQSFPASGSFPMSQLLTSGGPGTGVLASTSVLAVNIQDWSPLGWTGWISLQSKGLSRVFSNTTYVYVCDIYVYICRRYWVLYMYMHIYLHECWMLLVYQS